MGAGERFVLAYGDGDVGSNLMDEIRKRFRILKTIAVRDENDLFTGPDPGGTMNKKVRNSAVSHLFEAILTLETEEDCYSFFEDLCTVNELLSISQRFEVACMLRRHETYLQIAARTGASTATISRVNRSLHYGDD